VCTRTVPMCRTVQSSILFSKHSCFLDTASCVRDTSDWPPYVQLSLCCWKNCSFLCGKWLLLWEWESWLIHQCTVCKWPTMGWSGSWISSMLWAKLPTWGDCPLVLQAAAPGHSWWYWSSYMWGWTSNEDTPVELVELYIHWTLPMAAVWTQTTTYFIACLHTRLSVDGTLETARRNSTTSKLIANYVCSLTADLSMSF